MALKQFKARVLTPISDTTRTEKRRSSSRFPFSLSSLSAYLGVFLLIVSVVAMTYQPPQRQALASTSGLTGNTALNDVSQPTVDSMLATSVGATIAERTELPVAGNVLSLSQSLSIENTLAQTDTNTISKPQIVQPTADGRTPQQYTTITGDTIPTIAQRYNISAQTVKWANNLTSDAVAPGKTLTIPPTDGILYTVKSGDTVDSIAAKYKADKQLLITYNDLEVTGTPVVGSRILIPGGDLPATEQPGYVAPRRAVTYNYNYATYSGGQANGTAYYWTAGTSPGNRYGTGQCTFTPMNVVYSWVTRSAACGAMPTPGLARPRRAIWSTAILPGSGDGKRRRLRTRCNCRKYCTWGIDLDLGDERVSLGRRLESCWIWYNLLG
ncbi:LysM peptidoglycan-binding domain-containing protein [Candidatus Saccharibacteria bacterium]|nr:MAG: LysM peptidoglycan-binding domain-containing protein [Candidatus Saccharibacteria bacterium]